MQPYTHELQKMTPSFSVFVSTFGTPTVILFAAISCYAVLSMMFLTYVLCGSFPLWVASSQEAARQFMRRGAIQLLCVTSYGIDIDASAECVICASTMKGRQVYPCGHVVCDRKACGSRVTCPICRRPCPNGSVRLFHP